MNKHYIVPPDHPGALLREVIMPDLDLTPGQIAVALDIPSDQLALFLSEETPLTAEMAVKLSSFFCMKPETWLLLQQKFDLFYEIRNVDVSKIKQAKLL